MQQSQLIAWLKPIKFNSKIHVIIKSKAPGRCRQCDRRIYKDEYATWNTDKRTIKHINCSDPKITKRFKYK